jgi:predicted MPP superfamily phosphohydrolase
MKINKTSRLIIIIIIIGLLLATIAFSFLYATHWSQTNFQVEYHDVTSAQLPDDFDNTGVMFLSDLEYGTFFKKDRLDILQNKLSTLSADIIIFGGDLFDSNYTITETDIQDVTDFLKQLQAPLGKFAILGDFDIESSTRKTIVEQILFDADFEVLDQKTVLKVHNGTNSFINLVGIDYDPQLTDITGRFSTVIDSSFTMALIHGAAFNELLPINLCDITLCGHTHNFQLTVPGLGGYRIYPQTGSYKVGLTSTATTSLYLSSGLGETYTDARLFSDPSILFIRLKAK